MTTPGRHLGLFPEVAAHWDWFSKSIHHRVHAPSRHPSGREHREVNVLNLFGYTGLASLAAAAAGAKVTHVDASKKSVSWARENQALSGLTEAPIRWIVDDALKFAQREARRGVRYDGLILDPPKFGRGPKGEVWEVYKSLPGLLEACRACLSDNPLFVVTTIYAVRASAIHIAQAVAEMMAGLGGKVESGELVTREQSGGRLLSQAVYARWSAND
jgi:23S rRNA (cytosine1962-C5)-methyltransferase